MWTPRGGPPCGLNFSRLPLLLPRPAPLFFAPRFLAPAFSLHCEVPRVVVRQRCRSLGLRLGR
eukprot:3936492-Heterocapsa_arctica.AAC.1